MCSMLPPIRGKFHPKMGDATRNPSFVYCRKRTYQWSRPIAPKVEERPKSANISALGYRKKAPPPPNMTDVSKSASNIDTGPIIDTEVDNESLYQSTKMIRTQVKNIVYQIKLEEISELPLEQQLSAKLKLCTNIYDFVNVHEDVAAKEQKTRVLCEFVQFFEQSADSKKLSPELQEQLMQMIKANIIRPTPSIPLSPILLDFALVFVEPSWPQLFYVYQLLNRFISLYPESPLFNMDIVRSAIYLTNLPDNNERLQLLSFLRAYYDSHQTQKVEIIKCIQKKLADLQDLDSPPFCVMPLLVYLSHIFQRCNKAPPEEFYCVIRTSVFPLALNSYLPLYHQSMLSLLTDVLLPESTLNEEFHHLLVNFFPLGNGQKQPCFVDFLLLTMSKMSPAQVTNAIKPTMNVFEMVVSGEQIHAAQLILDFLATKSEQWVNDHSKRVILSLFDRVKYVTTNHWSQVMREKAQGALAGLGKLDRKSFLKAKTSKSSEQIRKAADEEKQAAKKWGKIVNVATNYEGDTTKLMDQIKRNFRPKKTTF